MFSIGRHSGSASFGLSCLLLSLSLVSGPCIASAEEWEVVVVHWRGFVDVEGAGGDSLHAQSADSTRRSDQAWLFQTPLGNRLEVRCVSEITDDKAWRSSCSLVCPDSGWAFERDVARRVGVEVLPFSGGLRATNSVFDRMAENPHLVTETITSGEFFTSYTAAESLEAIGDRPPTEYGMAKLQEDGFSVEAIAQEALDAVSFAFRANCGLRDQRDVEGDELCQILGETGLVRLLPGEVNRYLKLAQTDEQLLYAVTGAEPVSNAQFMMKWGRLKLVKASQAVPVE